jgi:hypothetical protein
MQLRTWLGVTTAATTMCGILVWGCSSDKNSGSGNSGADAGDAGVAGDAVSDAPCAFDVNLLAPVDAAANPVAAACQECIKANPTCLTAFETCNTDCVCEQAVVQFANCVGEGGTGAVCGVAVATDPTFASAPELQMLLVCQGVTCASSCSAAPPPADAGTDASDAGSADASDDGG